jgi:hypothetical protein
MASPPPASAGPSVTLNGVSIAGVANQRFENVNVVIDAAGNLDIQAKGYAVRGASSLAASAPLPVIPRGRRLPRPRRRPAALARWPAPRPRPRSG